MLLPSPPGRGRPLDLTRPGRAVITSPLRPGPPTSNLYMIRPAVISRHRHPPRSRPHASPCILRLHDAPSESSGRPAGESCPSHRLGTDLNATLAGHSVTATALRRKATGLWLSFSLSSLPLLLPLLFSKKNMSTCLPVSLPQSCVNRHAPWCLSLSSSNCLSCAAHKPVTSASAHRHP